MTCGSRSNSDGRKRGLGIHFCQKGGNHIRSTEGLGQTMYIVAGPYEIPRETLIYSRLAEYAYGIIGF